MFDVFGSIGVEQMGKWQIEERDFKEEERPAGPQKESGAKARERRSQARNLWKDLAGPSPVKCYSA